MKVNLIYDMRSGFSDKFDSYTNEERGEAVLAVLESSRHATEFNKMIKGLKEGDIIQAREVVSIPDLLTNSQKSIYETLKLRFI